MVDITVNFFYYKNSHGVLVPFITGDNITDYTSTVEGLPATLVSDPASSGNDILLTTTDKVAGGTVANYLSFYDGVNDGTFLKLISGVATIQQIEASTIISHTTAVKLIAPTVQLFTEAVALKDTSSSYTATINMNLLTGSVTQQVPDKSGTFAMISDIPPSTATTATTGTVIDFAASKIFGTFASPETGNITDTMTGAAIGITQKIYHNSGSSPTVPAGWVLVSGAYTTSVDNVIYAEWSAGTRVEYWIVQV